MAAEFVSIQKNTHFVKISCALKDKKKNCIFRRNKVKTGKKYGKKEFFLFFLLIFCKKELILFPAYDKV